MSINSRQLRNKYLSAVPRLEKVLKFIISKLETLSTKDFSFETNVKPIKSIKRKMEKRNILDPEKLSDLIRGRLYFSNNIIFKDVKKILNDLFHGHIKDIDKKEHMTNKFGLEYYGIMHVDIEYDGINFELQVIPEEFKPYKEYLHKIYEILRNPESSQSSDKKRDLKFIHNEVTFILDEISKFHRHVKTWPIDKKDKSSQSSR